MTTTPAMPELPEADYYLGFFNEGGAQLTGLRGYTADQMDARYLRGYNDALATLQAQPAEVSDEEIERIAIESDMVFRSGGKLLTQFLEHIDLTRNVHAFARAILALRPQAVPMTDEQAALEEEELPGDER